ncbi:DUF1345 domain-containing protein [Sulfurirhabdus autotrophica]|uniref:DUF1345 domain-containing protein n=1 Tax=Sulfurirhabdus autotrophica TaxID=1706046 RepID=UPI001CB92A7B|nr:DUF1345 domain-containing protein [Sulfurirhabdus autotrophica]
MRETRLLLAWNLGTLCYLVCAFAVMAGSDSKATHKSIQLQDQSGVTVLVLVVVAASAGVAAIAFMLGSTKELTFWPKIFHFVISFLALILSWMVIHTRFAFHYAHSYYRNKQHGNTESELIFPGNRQPDYLDFAYYAFVIGMTSQVSDVVISSRAMRRLTLVHSLFSFGFNMAILALSINILAGSI